MRRVLQIPAFRRLLAAYALNELALAIGLLTLAVLVYRHTGSAVGAAAFFITALFLPALVAPAVVARVDRFPFGRLLPVLYGLEAIAYGGLAALAGHVLLVPLFLLTFLDGILALTARSIARTAGVAVTSPVGLLREGNALTNTAFSVCFVAGPALGALIASQGGTVVALLTNCVLFVVIALTLLTAGPMPGAVAHESNGAGRLQAALRHAAALPAIRTLLGLQALGLLFFTISVPVEVVFALHVLHAGQGGYGALLSMWGAGTIVGSAIYTHWRSASPRALIGGGAALLGAGFAVMAAAPSLVVAMAGGVIAGVGNGIWAVAARTTLQEQVEPEWMGMMMSLNESVFQALPGIGIILGGALSALAGSRVALAVASAGAIAVAILGWPLLATLRVPEPLAPTVGAPERRTPRSSPTPTR
jgi:hypothetical protein